MNAMVRLDILHPLPQFSVMWFMARHCEKHIAIFKPQFKNALRLQRK